MHAVRGLEAFLQTADRPGPPGRALRDLLQPSRTAPARAKFWVGADGPVGQFSDGKALVKFRVETRATTRGQMAAVAAALNEWLAERN